MKGKTVAIISTVLAVSVSAVTAFMIFKHNANNR